MTKNVSLKIIVATLAIISASCNKESSLTVEDSNLLPASQSTIASLQAIAVAESASGKDSVYVIHTCDKNSHRDSISFAQLPASAITYLQTNYAGYIESKAFVNKDSAATVTGYVAIIQFNGKPVGLSFDANGNFVRVLEQREGRDLKGHGWHRGGRFDDRDGLKRDTIALNALPSAIISFYASNYPQDTMLKAFRNRDTSIVVVSANNAIYATVFTATGALIKRSELQAKPGKLKLIDITALPAAAQSYLASAYPNYVFKQGLAIINNGVVKGYVILIDANTTKYSIAFDAAGNFVQAKTIR